MADARRLNGSAIKWVMARKAGTFSNLSFIYILIYICFVCFVCFFVLFVFGFGLILLFVVFDPLKHKHTHTHTTQHTADINRMKIKLMAIAIGLNRIGLWLMAIAIPFVIERWEFNGDRHPSRSHFECEFYLLMIEKLDGYWRLPPR